MMTTMRRVSLWTAVMFIAAAAGNSAEWGSYTSMNYIRDVEYYNGAIWCASEGGILRFDLDSQEFTGITRADGLFGSDLYCLAVDSSGNVWCSGLEAMINIYDPSSGYVQHVTSLNAAATVVNDIYIDGNTIYAATDKGVFELFYEPLYNDYFVRGFYQKFGNFEQGIETYTAITFNDYLWVGTEAGAARIPLSTVNKQEPYLWQTFVPAQGLPNLKIYGFAEVNDTLYTAGRYNGVAWFDGTSFQGINTIQETLEIRALQDTLYAASDHGIRRIVNGVWETIGDGTMVCQSILKTPEGELWAGLRNMNYIRGGIANYDGGSWRKYRANSPGCKYIKALMMDSQNRLWCGGNSYTGKGVFVLDDNDWTTYTLQDSGCTSFFYTKFMAGAEGPRSFLEYPNGEVWCGSFGSGIAVYQPDGEQVFFNSIDSLSLDSIARVQGTSGSSSYAVIGEMVLDADNNIWLINREAANGTSLLMVPADFMVSHSPNIQWVGYTYQEAGFADPYQDYLVIDGQNRLWTAGISNSANGVYVFDFNSTPYNKNDDLSVNITSSNSELYYNSIRDLAVDQDNRLWIATSGGVNYVDIPETPITSINDLYVGYNYDMYAVMVNCIAVDPMNNKWFGTEEDGVVVLANDNYTILAYYNENTDPLLDNRITDITFDANKGAAYIATPEGISTVLTPYRSFGEELGKMKMGPSPFYLNGEENLTFAQESLTPGAVVKIFTINGLLVRKLSFTEAALGWDGRDNKGRLVGSGVYIVTSISPAGKAIAGKIPVIRR